jgi:TRAP-type C4-dicarboxylate transport system substrate-binding protein
MWFGRWIALALLVAMVLVPAAAAQAPEKVYKMRLATCIPDKPDGMSAAWAVATFRDRIKERSKGQLEVQVFWAGSLYCEVAAIKAMLDGAVELGTSSVQNAGTFTKAYFVLDMPYLFPDAEAVAKTVILGPFNRRLKELVMQDQPHLMPLILTLNEGLRDLQCSKKVLTPAELRGIKIRTTETPTDVATWKAFGAIATPIAWAETYTAGTQNLIQCLAVTTGFWLVNSKHYEWTKHVTLVDYQTQIHPININKKFFDSLPPDLRKLVLDTAAEVEREAVEVDKRYTDKWTEWLKTNGKQELHTLTPDHRRLLDHPDFVAARVHTRWVEEDLR